MAIQKLTNYVKDAGLVSRFARPLKDRLSIAQIREIEEELKAMTVAEWLFKKGGTNKEGAVIITNYRRTKYSPDGTRVIEPADCDPIVYEQLQEDLEQYRTWKARKEFAQKKQAEEYAQQAAVTSGV